MAFNIKIPYVIATHGKKFTSVSSINNKSKAFGFGLVGGQLYYNNGTTQKLVGVNTPVDVTGASVTITEALHGNRVVTLNRAAGIAVTLPAATGTGNIYTFIVGTTFTANGTIKVASATDFMVGTAFFDGDDAGNAANGFTTANTGTVATESDTITFFTGAGNTSGGIKGAIVQLIDMAAAQWAVLYTSAASGTEVTPFSATV